MYVKDSNNNANDNLLLIKKKEFDNSRKQCGESIRKPATLEKLFCIMLYFFCPRKISKCLLYGVYEKQMLNRSSV